MSDLPSSNRFLFHSGVAEIFSVAKELSSPPAHVFLSFSFPVRFLAAEEEADLHVNQQELGPQVTEIEQWPAQAKNRSGAVRGLEQHRCV